MIFHPPPNDPPRSLHRLDKLRPRTFAFASVRIHFELNLLSLLQLIEAGLFNNGMVEEYVLPIRSLDKSEALLRYHLLDLALRHVIISTYTRASQQQRHCGGSLAIPLT